MSEIWVRDRLSEIDGFRRDLPAWGFDVVWNREDWPSAEQRLADLACFIVGHRAQTHEEAGALKDKRGRRKQYRWRDCQRCYVLFWGTRPPISEVIARVYSHEAIFAPVMQERSRCWEDLRA